MKLTKSQEEMLFRAAERHGRFTPSGNESHFTYVGRGQAGTAKALEAMGLGGYTHDNGMSAAKFWIWDKGYELAVNLGGVESS